MSVVTSCHFMTVWMCCEQPDCLTARTDEPTVFECGEHTGSELRYNWTLGDGAENTHYEQNYTSHQYRTPGSYTPSVYVYNDISNAQFTQGTRVMIVILNCHFKVYLVRQKRRSLWSTRSSGCCWCASNGMSCSVLRPTMST